MKKIVKILTIISLLILINIINVQKVYGAVAFKESDTVLTNHTISEFYEMAKDIKGETGSLAGTTVNAHMANNREWATVSYFSNSNYGTGGAGGNTGTQLEDSSHYSTNENITGVMDWGKTITYTAGIVKNRPEVDTNLYNNGKSLIEEADTNPQIDNVTTLSALSIAKNGWYGSVNKTGENKKYPYSCRHGLFGCEFGAESFIGVQRYDTGAMGVAGNATFRAVFYAQ